MEQPLEQLRKLVEDQQYEKAVKELMKKANPTESFYFVSSMLTLAQMDVSRVVGSAKGGGAGVTIPDPSTLTPIGKLKISHGKSKTSGTSGTYPNEMIIAMGYHAVSLKDIKGCLARVKGLFGRRSVAIGPLRELTIAPQQMQGNATFFMGDDLESDSGSGFMSSSTDVSQVSQHQDLPEKVAGKSEGGEGIRT
jgi:hypothetical protein